MYAGASNKGRFTRGTRRTAACVLAAAAAWVLPTPQPADAAGPRLDRAERSLIRAINRVRTQYGLPRLRANRALNRSADFHCADMLRANFFGHASSNGTPMTERVRRYRPSHRIGETLAYLPHSTRRGAADEVVQMWMNSPGHRVMLLSPSFRRVGIGRRVGGLGKVRGAVYTADFASAR